MGRLEDAAAALAQAHAAHQRYRDHAPRMVPNGAGVIAVPGNKTLADTAFREAASHLAEAVALDPHRDAPEWQHAGYAAHVDALLAFYGRVMSA